MALVVDKLKGAASDAAEAVSHPFENAKVQSLKRDTVDVGSKTQSYTQTTDHGVPIGPTEQWLKTVSKDGLREGPSLLEDQIGREKIHRFDHERIPERVVHARGAGAHGHFKLFESAEEYTFAKVLTDTSRTTPVFVRFSTVQGSRGSADTVRDVRGFAVKFYTEEGNWDIVGNDIPVFFIQDAIKFPDFVHSVKPEPHNEVPQGQSAHNNFWDFVNLHSEATHMFCWVMSDRGIPRSYRMMQGFGVNTFTMINAQGKKHFVKFHFTPELGVHSLVWDEALKINGQDPDFHRKDLEEAIVNGAYPKWKFGVQVIPEEREHEFEFDILDATKIWPEDVIPVKYIGEMELNKVVDEYFTEVEQVAFCTSHIVPGIGFSNDPLLQGRNFSYFDTQISRLGINWEELPINRPICPYMNFNRDGAMRHRISKGTVNYWPNRFEQVPPNHPEQSHAFVEHKTVEPESIKTRMHGKKFGEHYKQAQMFYNSLSPVEQSHLVDAFAFELSHCDDSLVYKRMGQKLTYISLDLAQKVCEKIGVPVPQTALLENTGKDKSEYISQFKFLPAKPTIATRRIAILVADGYDTSVVGELYAALEAEGATPFMIGEKRAIIKPGTKMADHHWEGQRSTLFDALFVPSGEHVATLQKSGRVKHWIREAFGHCKAIAAVGNAAAFVAKTLDVEGVKYADTEGSNVVDSYGVITGGSGASTAKVIKSFTDGVAKHRCWERETEGLCGQVAY